MKKLKLCPRAVRRKCLIVGEGYIPRPLGRYKGMNPETNTLPKQHTPSACGGVVDFVKHIKQEEARNAENGELHFNAETIAAFKEGEAMLRGEIPAKWHKSLDDLDKILGL